MKVLCLLVLCLALATAEVSEEQKAKLMEITAECKEETKASDADVELIKEHKAPTDTEGKCYIACIMEKLGTFSDGKMIKDEALKLASAIVDDEDKLAHAESVLTACADLDVSDDRCEAAAEYGECIMDGLHKE